MGFTVFGATVLVCGIALLIAAVVLGVLRARRRDYAETRLLVGVGLCGILGLIVLASAVIFIAVPDSQCAAC